MISIVVTEDRVNGCLKRLRGSILFRFQCQITFAMLIHRNIPFLPRLRSFDLPLSSDCTAERLRLSRVTQVPASCRLLADALATCLCVQVDEVGPSLALESLAVGTIAC